MDCLSPHSGVERVVLMWSAQVGKSEIGANFQGYIIHLDPGPTLVVNPTVEMAKTWSKDRLAPMLRDTPALRGLVSTPRSRDGDNTVLSKSFKGGFITMAGANAPAGLAARPIRYLILDEVDRYPVSAGTEGDPVSLAIKRTTTFWNKKILIVSTPTIDGASRIAEEFERSDQRRFWVPCPDCGEMQVLRFGQVKWDGDPAEAFYCCEHCGVVIPSHRKMWMLRRGEWRATFPGRRVAGFHINELYSPWRTFGQTASDFVAAKDNPDFLRTWVNTALGETFKEKGDAPEWQSLYDRREEYDLGVVPAGGLLLTAGVDVQDNRLECSIWAWGRNRERWLIDHRVSVGDPAGSEVWVWLEAILSETFPHERGGSLKIERLAIDTGGHKTQHVYNWCRRQSSLVLAIKGRENAPSLISTPTAVDVTAGGKRISRGLMLWPVDGGRAKAELFADLYKPAPVDGEAYPAGYVHLPKVDAEFCQQLCSEELVTKRKRNGVSFRQWQQIRDRNEALDCYVYARAAAAHVGVDRFSDERWDQLSLQVEPAPLQLALEARNTAPVHGGWLEPVDDGWI